jgi:outer membrane protein OmpA-like peptidoglycan-associated protein
MKKILAAAVFIIGATLMMDAQTVITNESLTHDGTNVTVTFDVDTDVKGLPSNRKEVLLPYIYDGKDTLYFDALEIYGKGRYKRERQINHINGDKHWELSENQTLKGGIYSYMDQVPLKRWMKSANLAIKRQLVGCNCENELDEERLKEGVALFEEPALPPRRIPGYVLVDATRSWDFGQDELEIIFKVSKIEIDSSVFNNEITFGKILDAVDKIYSNPHFKLDKIEVAGYASPEGTPEFNRWLGENRAKALIDYIIEQRPQYNLTRKNFRVRNGEENWAGLRRVVAASNLEHKDRVIAIIDNDEIPADLKKSKIRWIDKAQTWKQMLHEIYPYLRCARYLAIYYDSSNDKAVEIINTANQMIREGKYAEAYEHVKQVDDDLRAYNTVGVALMMQGEFEKAMPWLVKAVEANTPAAQKNIDAINAEYEFEAKQRQLLEEYLKKYE